MTFSTGNVPDASGGIRLIPRAAVKALTVGLCIAFSLFLKVVAGDAVPSFVSTAPFASSAFASSSQPNLIPRDVVLSSYAALPGDVITLEWTTTNSGNGFAFATFTAVRLGTSPSAPPTSSFVDLTFTTPEVPAKSAVRQSVSVTIPANTPLGTYYIWIMADLYGGANQSTRADDVTRSAALTVQSVRGQPNLRPMDIIVSPLTVQPGGPLMVMWTLTNSGSATCPASYTGFHLGTSSSGPPDGDLLNLVLPTPEIPTSSALRFTNIVTIPSQTPPGTYYLWVVADDVQNSTLNQSSRTDDAARSPAFSVASQLPQPNLKPLTVTLSHSSVRPGSLLTVTCTITNTGPGDCPASITGLHLGTSATEPPSVDLLNIKLPTPAISAGGSVQLTNVVTIPLNTPLGAYYVWVIVDDVPSSTLNQTTRTDDAARSGALTVAAIVARPNLVPQNVLLGAYSVRPGDQLAIMWTITNTGNGDCPASLTGLRLGTSATEPPAIDPLNLRISTPGIPAESAVRQTNLVTIPPTTPTGNYYIWVIADDAAQSTLDQTSRDDDAARSALLGIVSVPGQPNLVPQNVTLGTDSTRPGDSITVRWSMRNLGNVIAPGSFTGVRLGQSASAPPTNGLVQFRLETPEIAAGSALQQTNAFTIPTNAPIGTYYVWVIADGIPRSSLNQSSRADDAARSGPLAIVNELPRPNLIPLNVSLNVGSTQPGGQVLVTWMMTNSGSANCPASTTGLHLGTSETTAPTNNNLNVKVATPAIHAHSSIQQSNLVAIPENTPPGTYFIWIVADDLPNSALNQSSRADDAARSSPFAVSVVALNDPAPNAIVNPPPLFSWSAAGVSNPSVYLANKPAPVLGTDSVVFFDSVQGTNSLQLSLKNWEAAVSALGYAPAYYWTIGNRDPAGRQAYAAWSPLKATALIIEGSTMPDRTFRLQVLAPNQPQVVIQSSTNLSSWVDLGTLQNMTGTVPFSDPAASTLPYRFYRTKQ